jgi:ATP-binding cassette subfamily B protein
MNESFRDFAKLNIRINRILAATLPAITLFMSLAIVAVVWFGGNRINSGNMQIGDIAAVMEYGMIMLMYLVMAVFASFFLPRAKACAARVREIL